MKKARIATVWLDGCSGCHMSFLDLDQRLLTVAVKADLVYSPLVDVKEFPKGVDVALVEGAVSNAEDLEKIKTVRARSRILVALGDCAVTSNVPAMRNPFGVKAILERAYLPSPPPSPLPEGRPGLPQSPIAPQSRVDAGGSKGEGCIPNEVVPPLLPQARPIHEFVKVDVFVQGCPPSADAIFQTISEILEGRVPVLAPHTKFG